MMPMITKEKILMLLDEACRDLDVHVALGRLPEAKVTYGQLKTAQSYIEKTILGKLQMRIGRQLRLLLLGLLNCVANIMLD